MRRGLPGSGGGEPLLVQCLWVSFAERMRIDGAEILEEDVVRMMERVRLPASTMFFELVTALTWLHLAGVLW